MAKPLYEALKGPIQEPLDPSWPVSGHFKNLLQALLQSLALPYHTSLALISLCF
jgi:hypothetical protein